MKPDDQRDVGEVKCLSSEMSRVGEIAKQIDEYAKWASRSATHHKLSAVGAPVVERVQHVASASLLESAAVRAGAWAEELAELSSVASVREVQEVQES